jgi:hypothetical protein
MSRLGGLQSYFAQDLGHRNSASHYDVHSCLLKGSGYEVGKIGFAVTHSATRLNRTQVVSLELVFKIECENVNLH